MADIIPALSVISIMLLIISVPVDVQLAYENSLILDVNFMLFGAHFSFSKGKSKKKHASLNKRTRNFRSLSVFIPSIIRAFDFLISHSRITMQGFSYTTGGEDYAATVKRASLVSAIRNVILAYLSSRAITLDFTNKNQNFSHNKNAEFDRFSFNLKFQLISIHILFAIAVFLFDVIKKNMFTRNKRNVRKQNE